MIGFLNKTGIGSFLWRRDIFKRLERAEEFRGTALGKHILMKVKEERASLGHFPPEDLANIDKKINSLETLFQ